MIKTTWKLSKEDLENSFGPLAKYVADDDVTDINFNSGNLWITHVNELPVLASDPEITEDVMLKFAIRAGNSASMNFNANENILYADTDTLRITCTYDNLSTSGITVAIRKSLPRLRFTFEDAIATGYASEKILDMLINCVLAHRNFVFCGLPGHGKTEAAKFLSSYIPAYDTVITLEDVQEWHYKAINPGKSCIEFKTNMENLEEVLAVSLRLNPEWIMFAETRSLEVDYLLKAWSNGICSMSTLHVADTSDVPDRYLNMLGIRENTQSVIGQVFAKAGIAVLTKRVVQEGKIRRYIDQVRFYYRKDGTNDSALVVENGVLHEKRIPAFIREEIEEQNGRDIFAHVLATRW